MFQLLGEGTDSPEPCTASTAGHQLLECCWPCQRLPADHSHEIKFNPCDIGEWCPFFSQPHSWGWTWLFPLGLIRAGREGDGWDFKGPKRGWSLL